MSLWAKSRDIINGKRHLNFREFFISYINVKYILFYVSFMKILFFTFKNQPFHFPQLKKIYCGLNKWTWLADDNNVTLNNTFKMTNNSSSDQYAGYLQKWTNYLKGYQRRWFVLKDGLLSYYRYS